jgi:hypothetical protein
MGIYLMQGLNQGVLSLGRVLILAGVATFKRGFIWRVGNGEDINIWSDPWILTCPDFKVTMLRGNAVYTKANELINPH